jgi:hypothetical protein
MTPIDVAAYMCKNGDYRNLSNTTRSIRRMPLGNMRVDGAMQAVVTILLRQRLRLRVKYSHLQWQKDQHGVYSTQIENWQISLRPQTNRRWRLSCRHVSSGHISVYRRWLESLDEAKDTALFWVEEAMNDEAMTQYQGV